MAKKEKDEVVTRANEAPAVDAEMVEKLLKKVEALEKENKETKAQLATKAPAEAPVVKREKHYVDDDAEVDIFLPLDDNKYSDDLYISVNGKNCKIKRNEHVKIKGIFYNALIDSMDQDATFARFNMAMMSHED